MELATLIISSMCNRLYTYIQQENQNREQPKKVHMLTKCIFTSDLSNLYDCKSRITCIENKVPFQSKIWNAFLNIGTVHHIPDTYHIPDNLSQPISKHTWMFLFCCLFVKSEGLKRFINNNFYHLKVIKLLLEWPWSDVLFHIIQRNITQNL